MGKLAELLSAPYADLKGIQLESAATWPKPFQLSAYYSFTATQSRESNRRFNCLCSKHSRTSHGPILCLARTRMLATKANALSLRFSDQRLCHDNLSSTTQKETMIGRSLFNECLTTHNCKVLPNFSANNGWVETGYHNAENLKRSFLFSAESLTMLVTLKMILMVDN